MKSSVILALGASASAWAGGLEQLHQRQSNWTVGQTVQTSSGPVAGHAATNDSQVSEYLGIPFGQPAVGDLRWAAPVRFNGTAALNGTKFGFSCPVLSSSGTITASALAFANVTSAGIEVFESDSNAGASYSEDCLYLNVWTKPQTGDAKKAVLVWIYGGAFTGGSSSIPSYNGANLANEEDVIVVSINYRLSILGFPGAPGVTQNLGLLDQRLAVEWVRDNIANFGGDVSRITLFGQSAGGASVDYYSYAWGSDPIAAGFIPESGTAFSWGLPTASATAAASWYNVSATLGCGDASSDAATVLTCMRTKNYTEVLTAIPSGSGASSILGPFGPTVDGTVIFSNYTGRTPAKVPMLIGNNNYEAGLFRTELALENVTYPDVFWDDFNLQEFTCPAGIRANASVANGNPTWRYRYFGVWDNLEISPEAGTWHGAEIAILFNTAPSSPPATAQEVAFANYMRGAWAAFAKDPVNGLTTYSDGWPAYDPAGETLIRLAYNNATGTNVALPSLYDALCIYANVSNTNTSAYLAFPTTPGNSTGSTSTGSGTATGSATPSSPTISMGSRDGMSIFVVLGAVLTAYLMGM